jgi:hypothetical protein
MDALEIIEGQDGFTAEIHVDEDALSPADWDNLGTLVGLPELTRNYSIAERGSSGDETEIVERRGAEGLRRLLALRGEIAVPFRFEDYGSSGARLYADEDGDNPSGFLVTTHERVNELCGTEAKYHEPEWIAEALRGELKVWGQYVEGDVYGVIVKDAEGNVTDDGSLWGLYGSEYAEEEAEQMLRDAVEDAREAAAKEKQERERAARMDVATV